MTEEEALRIVAAMEGAMQLLNTVRQGKISQRTARALAIAATELEAAQLWVANARAE